MNKQDIQQRVAAIVQCVTGRELNERYYIYSLTGVRVGLSYLEMVCLYIELCRAFPAIQFTAEDLNGYRFNSVSAIAACICAKYPSDQTAHSA